MENRPQHGPRIGTFFLLIGFVSFFLFLLSGFSRQPAFGFFFLGLITLLIGFQLRRGQERSSSGRFRMIQQWRERQQKQEDKDKDEDKH
jgi:flagellar biosynthesis component FlhA